MKKLRNIRKWPTEKISQTVLYILVGLSALVFLLFYLVGYNMQSVENPDFNAPLFTDVLLVFMLLLLVAAIVIGGVAAYFGIKKSDASDKVVNGVPSAKISAITFGFTFVVLVLTFIFGSTDSMLINGHQFTDVFSLKLSDMFVLTSLIMILVAIGAVIFGCTRYIRKEKKS